MREGTRENPTTKGRRSRLALASRRSTHVDEPTLAPVKVAQWARIVVCRSKAIVSGTRTRDAHECASMQMRHGCRTQERRHHDGIIALGWWGRQRAGEPGRGTSRKDRGRGTKEEGGKYLCPRERERRRRRNNKRAQEEEKAPNIHLSPPLVLLQRTQGTCVGAAR